LSAPGASPVVRSPAYRAVALVLGGLFAFNLMVILFGEAPLATLAQALAGTWGTPYGVGQVLFKATPLLFTGLAFVVALESGLFNIGAEGQLALASFAGAWVATKLPAGVPGVVVLCVALVTAVVVGGGYSAIAGVMRARLRVHEIISGIMLNRSADVLLPWLLVAGLGASGLRSADIPGGARLPALDAFFAMFRGSAASLAFPFAVLVVVATYAWLGKSRLGREIRWVGLNATACEAQGIPVSRRRIQAMVLSGAIVGLAITGTVLGYKGYFELGLGAGAGFSGIAVAMVGRRSALGLVLAALCFGTLAQAGLAINARVPKEAMGVLEAVLILLAAAATATRAPASGAAESDAPTSAGSDQEARRPA
jgi:simple sugar transport system permease protein